MFNAQVRADFETLEVTINNYERMANAPEALERIKKLVEGLPQADNIPVTEIAGMVRAAIMEIEGGLKEDALLRLKNFERQQLRNR